jgi:hypothetical protein
MKHLRKYNEDIESDLQGIEYIIDFIDKGALINRRDNNGIYNIIKVSIIIMEVGKIANIMSV